MLAYFMFKIILLLQQTKNIYSMQYSDTFRGASLTYPIRLIVLPQWEIEGYLNFSNDVSNLLQQCLITIFNTYLLFF